MLIFTRKDGQSVVVQVAGHAPLTITFRGSRPGKCQLAFDGPLDYRVLREELTRGEPHDSARPCAAAVMKCIEPAPSSRAGCAT